MSLTVYSRQIYAMIFFYFVIVFFLNLNIKTFIQTSIIIGVLAVPGIIFVLIWPNILKATFEFKIYNSLLVNSSIIALYLIPFYMILFFFEKKKKIYQKQTFGIFFNLIVINFFFNIFCLQVFYGRRLLY